MLLNIDKVIPLSVLFIKHGFPASVIPDEQENSILSLNLGNPPTQTTKTTTAFSYPIPFFIFYIWYQLVSMGTTVA